MGARSIRLGIVDDHPVFRVGLIRTLEREAGIKVLWELGSATDLIQTVAASPVDAVLMDLNLGPSQDSLGATRALIQRHPRIKVIVISKKTGRIKNSIFSPFSSCHYSIFLVRDPLEAETPREPSYRYV